LANHLVVQASAVMFRTLSPEGWTVVFGVFVTNQDGTPVEGLKKSAFSCWDLTSFGQVKINLVTDLLASLPTSKMRGIYCLQTQILLGPQAPVPQQFMYSLRVARTIAKVTIEGFTTVDVTYLGKPQ
jgi:hypothetical protein